MRRGPAAEASPGDSRPARDGGTSTIIALGMCLALLSLLLTLGLLAQVIVARHRAAAAADLGALAAADVVRGLAAGDPCDVAREAVERNGAELEACVASYLRQSASVEARRKLPAPLPPVKQLAVAGAPPEG